MSFEIKEHIGTIRTTNRGAKEVNLVSWYGAEPKVDIRDWDADHTRCGKGLPLNTADAKKLCEILTEYFKEAK